MLHNFKCLKEHRLFSDLLLQHYRHEHNGLEVVISPNSESDVLALQIWYQVGSANEDPEATGLAHFFEHMMFRGTKKNGLGEFDRQMEELGTPWGTNAFTWKDYTAYVVDIPSAGLEKALELEADRMVNLDLTESNIHEERGAVLDEKHRSLNDYSSQRFDALFEKAFEGGSSAWPVLGYEEHIRDYHPELLQNYYKKHYAPNNALIVLCGNVIADEVLPLIEKYFGEIPASNIKRTQVQRRLVPGKHRLKQPISLPRLALNYALDAEIENPWLWDLVGLILSGNEASLFEKELVIPGKVLSNSYWLCESARVKDSDSFIHFSFTLMEGVLAEDVISLCHTLFANSEEWMTEEMLQAALISARCQFYSSFSKFDDRASLLGETWIYEGKTLDSLQEQEQFYNKVTVEEVVVKIKSLTDCPSFVLETYPK